MNVAEGDRQRCIKLIEPGRKRWHRKHPNKSSKGILNPMNPDESYSESILIQNI